MNSTSIKYKYALSQDGLIFDINDLSEDDRADYECLGCGNVLRPVLGKIRKKHFRHKVNQECSLETYLHRMAKKLFIKTYQSCLNQKTPYVIEYPVPSFCTSCNYGPCETDNEIAEYDLTKTFIYISEEQKDGMLIPDVLLQAKSGMKLYIEIAVTHQSSINKVDSGMKIIEFQLNTEEDLEVFNKNRISFFIDDVKLYNFKPAPLYKKLKTNVLKK